MNPTQELCSAVLAAKRKREARFKESQWSMSSNAQGRWRDIVAPQPTTLVCMEMLKALPAVSQTRPGL
jgi:carbamate kinase